MAVLTTVYVVCRPTVEEANEFFAYYVDQNADWEGADRLMKGLLTHSKTFPPEVQDKIRVEMAAGHGSWRVVGTPKMVADKLIQLHSVGFCGTTVSFVDYIKDTTSVPWIMSEFKYIFENPYDVTSLDGFSCDANRPPSQIGKTSEAISDGMMPFMNHFLYDSSAIDIDILKM